MFPHSTLNLLAFPRLVNNPSGVECRLWTMEPARVFYFDDVVILPNILIMSDGRRLADDGNSSIRTMKTSSDRKLMEIFIFNTMSGIVGWCDGVIPTQPNIRNKNSILECFQCQWLCQIGLSSQQEITHTYITYIVKRRIGKQKTLSGRRKNFYFERKVLSSGMCWFARPGQFQNKCDAVPYLVL